MTEDPTFARAVALHQRGDIGAAEQLYRQILRLQPRHAGALHLLGAIHLQRGDLTESLTACEAALAMNSGNAAVHETHGDALHDLKRYEQAIAAYDRCLALDPRSFVAWSNRGSALLHSRRFDEAVASYERALALQENGKGRTPPRWLANPYLNRGAALQELGRFDAALESYDRAVAADPALAAAHANRGCTLDCLGRPQEALSSCERAIALSPDYPVAHLNRAMSLLRLGRFAEGWAEYEWRWRNTESALFRDRRWSSVPLWLGREPLAGKTILLHAEQGYGDTLQFCRYARLVGDRGARVVLEVHPALKRLLRGLEGVAQVISRDEPAPDVDLQCPLMSLPLAFGTTLESVPSGQRYLTAEPELVERWRARLGERRGFRVGLVWSGGFRPNEPEYWSANARRNIEPERLVALDHPRIEYVSLQKEHPAQGEPREERRAARNGLRMVDQTHGLSDFAETAALMESLDLVISVDTATAHLAAALGKPTWILSRFDGCWRWMLGRSDSPWYPSVRLFRQQAPGAWDEVVRQVRDELFRLVA
ncbi:MAG TPA: tetratricopeptide repeat protein [Steroidobacteraceae bacterium]|nr:tetratricopeptide repeat protein [Steroidobacteraceae bacterium]